MSASGLRTENDHLVVPVGTPIPSVCLRCGTTEGVTYHQQTFPLGTDKPSTVPLGTLVGASVLAVVLRQVFDNDALLLVMLAAVMILVIVIGGRIERARALSVHLQLPRCPSCHAIQTRQERQDSALGFAFIISGSLLLVGMILDIYGSVLAGGVLLVGTFVFLLFRVRRPAASILSAWVKEREVALILNANIARQVVQRVEDHDLQEDVSASASSASE